MRWKVLPCIYLIVGCSLVEGGNKLDCCLQEPNKIIGTSSKLCTNGDTITLKCDDPIAFDTVDGGVINDNILELEDTNFTSDQFCVTRNNITEIYMLCLPDEDIIESTGNTLNKITLLISVIFLIPTIVIYLSVPAVLDLQGICIIHSISGLTLAYIVLIIINCFHGIPMVPCLLLSKALYFTIMYAIFWQNVLSFHIWRTTLSPEFLKNFRSWKLLYHLYGILGPIILLTLLMIFHHSHLFKGHDLHPGLGEGFCWFKSLKVQFIYFYAPMAIILALTMSLYLWTVIYTWKILGDSDVIKSRILKYRLKMCVKLFFILGLTWIIEIISAATVYSENEIARIFSLGADLLTGLEGLIIFIILVVLRKKVVRGLAERKICGCIKTPASWRHLEDEEEQQHTVEEISLREN